MNSHRDSRPRNIWPIAVILFGALLALQCNGPPDGTPVVEMPTPVVSDLGWSSNELLPGEEAKIWVNVGVADPNVPIVCIWSPEAGEIIRGQGITNISYKAPDTPGNYGVRLRMEYGDWYTERSMSIVVVAPTPTPSPTPTGTPSPTNTPTPTTTHTPTWTPTSTDASIPTDTPTATPMPPTPTPTPSKPCFDTRFQRIEDSRGTIQEVRGYVYDMNRQPLKGVVVEIYVKNLWPRFNRQTLTTDDGEFALENLGHNTNNEYILRVIGMPDGAIACNTWEEPYTFKFDTDHDRAVVFIYQVPFRADLCHPPTEFQ